MEEQQPELIPVNFNFRSLGLRDNFLEDVGIDRSFFNSIPYEVQMEVIYANINNGTAQ